MEWATKLVKMAWVATEHKLPPARSQVDPRSESVLIWAVPEGMPVEQGYARVAYYDHEEQMWVGGGFTVLDPVPDQVVCWASIKRPFNPV